MHRGMDASDAALGGCTLMPEGGRKIRDDLQMAEVYAYRREADLAVEWLERAYAQRDPGLSSIKSNTLLRNLHGDLRWQLFLEKMGLAT
jgi:hypothetical protein